MPGEADKIASDVQAKWAAAFAKLDADALSSLYSRHGFLYGSNPNLYRGKDGAKAYFSGLPRWQSQSVDFTDIVTEAVGTDVVSMAGTANFVFDKDAADGQDHLGDRARGRRLEDFEPSRVVEGAAAVGRALASPSSLRGAPDASEAIQTARRAVRTEFWIRFASLAPGMTREFEARSAFPRRDCVRALLHSCPSRRQRAQGMPGAGRTHGLAG